MKNTNQPWKYTWNPQGYFETEIKIDLTKKYKNNTFTMNHTFFKSKDCKLYTYTSSGNKKFYNCHEELKDNTDFLFSNKDEDLSKLCNSSVYSRIKLISTRVINLTEIYCDCYFVADVIDPSIFNQDLHQEADVEHNSLKLKNGMISKQVITEDLSGSWGSIKNKELFIKEKITSEGLILSKTGLIFESNDIVLGSNEFNIKFDKEKECAYIQTGQNRKGILLRAPFDDNTPNYHIPVILPDDKTQIKFLDWLSLDPIEEGIKTKSILLEDIELKKNKIILGKNSLKFSIDLDNQKFIEFDREKLKLVMFDGLITIDIKTKTVVIGSLILDGNFMRQFIQMQRDIQDLKNKIK